MKGLSGHGKTILQLNKAKIRVKNGWLSKDKDIGNFTCPESKGSPVVDSLNRLRHLEYINKL